MSPDCDNEQCPSCGYDLTAHARRVRAHERAIAMHQASAVIEVSVLDLAGTEDFTPEQQAVFDRLVFMLGNGFTLAAMRLLITVKASGDEVNAWTDPAYRDVAKRAVQFLESLEGK